MDEVVAALAVQRAQAAGERDVARAGRPAEAHRVHADAELAQPHRHRRVLGPGHLDVPAARQQALAQAQDVLGHPAVKRPEGFEHAAAGHRSSVGMKASHPSADEDGEECCTACS